jgi:hypothetical protein
MKEKNKVCLLFYSIYNFFPMNNLEDRLIEHKKLFENCIIQSMNLKLENNNNNNLAIFITSYFSLKNYFLKEIKIFSLFPKLRNLLRNTTAKIFLREKNKQQD